ncbi:MAG: hypothetical protein WBV94_00115 [Blastocatellia bacterium]
MKIGRIKFSRLRAACALLALLLNWMSAPISLAAYSPDVCSMACCINEGYCCCKPHHRYVEGQLPDGSDQINTAQFSTACPEGCAAPQSSAKLLLRDSARTANSLVFSSASVLVYSHSTILTTKSIETGPSSPRAPPSLLLAQIA